MTTELSGSSKNGGKLLLLAAYHFYVFLVIIAPLSLPWFERQLDAGRFFLIAGLFALVFLICIYGLLVKRTIRLAWVKAMSDFWVNIWALIGVVLAVSLTGDSPSGVFTYISHHHWSYVLAADSLLIAAAARVATALCSITHPDLDKRRPS